MKALGLVHITHDLNILYSDLSVSDAPFESVEATFPEGPHSALTTNLPLEDHYSLCGQHPTIRPR